LGVERAHRERDRARLDQQRAVSLGTIDDARSARAAVARAAVGPLDRFKDGEVQASARRSGGSSTREPAGASARSEAGGARRGPEWVGGVPIRAVRSAGSHNRTRGPELGGKAPPQGAEVMQGGFATRSTSGRGLAGDRSGAIGGSTDPLGVQQQVAPQFMPHLQWWATRGARRVGPAEVTFAVTSPPQASHKPISAIPSIGQVVLSGPAMSSVVAQLASSLQPCRPSRRDGVTAHDPGCSEGRQGSGSGRTSRPGRPHPRGEDLGDDLGSSAEIGGLRRVPGPWAAGDQNWKLLRFSKKCEPFRPSVGSLCLSARPKVATPRGAGEVRRGNQARLQG